MNLKENLGLIVLAIIVAMVSVSSIITLYQTSLLQINSILPMNGG